MWFGFGAVAIRCSARALDGLVDELAAANRLVASDTPATPIGALPGDRVLDEAFLESGARAVTWFDDTVVLVDPRFCLDVLTDGADDTVLRAISRTRDVLVVWHGHSERKLRRYREGAVSEDADADVDAALHAFIGRHVATLAALHWAIYDGDLATIRRFGGKGEWARGVSAIVVRGGAGRELAIARACFGRVEPTGETITALQASLDHGFADVAALGIAGEHALLFPGHWKVGELDVDALATALAPFGTALVVRWSQLPGEDCWIARLADGRAVREPTSVDAPAFEARLRTVCDELFASSLAWLFGPTIELVCAAFGDT